MKKTNVDKDLLSKLYLEDKLTPSEISKYMNISPTIVINRLHLYSVPMRTAKEARKICVEKGRIGVQTTYRGKPLLTKEEKRIKHNAQGRSYCLRHPDKVKLKMEQDKIKYPIQRRGWWLIHGEEQNAKRCEKRLNNLDVFRERGRKASALFYVLHPEQCYTATRLWAKNNPDKQAINQARSNAIRKKQFGFVPLNNWFLGCEGHHVDTQHVIHIPKKLHRGIWHSVTKNIHMEQINNIAYKFLETINYDKR